MLHVELDNQNMQVPCAAQFQLSRDASCTLAGTLRTRLMADHEKEGIRLRGERSVGSRTGKEGPKDHNGSRGACFLDMRSLSDVQQRQEHSPNISGCSRRRCRSSRATLAQNWSLSYD